MVIRSQTNTKYKPTRSVEWCQNTNYVY